LCYRAKCKPTLETANKKSAQGAGIAIKWIIGSRAASFWDMENPPKIQPPKPLGENLKQHWLLKEDVAFLNHGSFGACPIPVLNEQQKWRGNIEAQPIELLGRRCEMWLMSARVFLLSQLGLPVNIGFVTNATGGINVVLRALSC